MAKAPMKPAKSMKAPAKSNAPTNDGGGYGAGSGMGRLAKAGLSPAAPSMAKPANPRRRGQ